jgi:hypothetical protein
MAARGGKREGSGRPKGATKGVGRRVGIKGQMARAEAAERQEHDRQAAEARNAQGLWDNPWGKMETAPNGPFNPEMEVNIPTRGVGGGVRWLTKRLPIRTV